jgi:hypothetical protein
MSNVDAVAARLRRLLHWAAFVGCAAAAVAIGLLTDEAFLYAAAEPETAAPIAHIEQVATAEPAYLGFAASPVTETAVTAAMGITPNDQPSIARRAWCASSECPRRCLHRQARVNLNLVFSRRI